MRKVLPILFNTEMVRAILDGRKTCTRRLVKTRRKDACGFYVTRKTDDSFAGIYEYDENESMFDNPLEPPYQPGDILYVRETWKKALNGYYYYESWQKNDIADITKWKPSIHMPKEAARIWLKVTDVRVERLQEMDWREALDEGVNTQFPRDKETGEYIFDENPIDDFIDLWNSTIKKSDLDRYGWNANPWVWVIEFERCEKPEGV